MIKYKIKIRDYTPKEDDVELAELFFHTIHSINIRDYTEEQIEAWAPQSTFLDPSKVKEWTKRFARTKPIIALIEDKIVGFAELEPNGHIDCFYCHHEWIGKGVGSALMQEVYKRAKNNHTKRIFTEASITAKPFFESHHFVIIEKQTVYLNGVGLTNYKMERSIS